VWRLAEIQMSSVNNSETVEAVLQHTARAVMPTTSCVGPFNEHMFKVQNRLAHAMKIQTDSSKSKVNISCYDTCACVASQKVVHTQKQQTTTTNALSVAVMTDRDHEDVQLYAYGTLRIARQVVKDRVAEDQAQKLKKRALRHSCFQKKGCFILPKQSGKLKTHMHAMVNGR
jgi:hypothetical protein